MTQDHDISYKALFGHPEMVRDLLLQFLGDELVHHLDYSTLQTVKCDFANDAPLVSRQGDMVWKVRCIEDAPDNDANGWLYLFVLLEFQSTVDHLMALRLMTYLGLLYQRLIKSKEISPDRPLPPVLPLVLYNGKRIWHAPLNIADLISPLPPSLKHLQPDFSYKLIALNRLSDRDLSAKRNLAAAVFRLETAASVEEVLAVTDELIAWLADRPDISRSIGLWMRSVMKKMLAGQENYDKLYRNVESLMEVRAMLAENLEEWAKKREVAGEARGQARGKLEGKIEGKLEGRVEGEALLLQRLLSSRFGAIPAEITAKIGQAQAAEIENWFDRALRAQCLQEIFD